MVENLYDLLGVDKNASQDEIKKHIEQNPKNIIQIRVVMKKCLRRYHMLMKVFQIQKKIQL